MKKKEKELIKQLTDIGFVLSKDYPRLGKNVYTKKHGCIKFIIKLFWFDVYTDYDPLNNGHKINYITSNLGLSTVDELKQLMYLMTKTEI